MKHRLNHANSSILYRKRIFNGTLWLSYFLRSAGVRQVLNVIGRGSMYAMFTMYGK